MKTTSVEMLLSKMVELGATAADMRLALTVLKGVETAPKAKKKVVEVEEIKVPCPPSLLAAITSDPKTTPGKNGGLYYKSFAAFMILCGTNEAKKNGGKALFKSATLKAAAAGYGMVL